MTVYRLPPTTPEQRSTIYGDVRAMLVPGFIGTSIRIDDTSLALRTLSPKEFLLLRYRAEGAKEYQTWAIAMSIWMVDGQIVGQHQEALRLIHQKVQSWSGAALNHIYQILNQLTRRWFATRDVLEAYFYERESRDLWVVEGRSLVENSFGVTGLNEIQRAWIAFNRIEDDWETWKQQWSLAKFMVNPHAPKGITRINDKDREREREMEARRSAIRDRVYYETIGVIPKLDAKARQQAAKTIKKAETFEELEEEMKNWVEGIRDDHDTIIDGIKERIRERVLERRKLEQERLEELERAFQEESQKPVEDLRGVLRNLSQEELAEMTKGAIRSPTIFHNPTHNHAFDKYLARRASPGSLATRDGKIVSNVEISEQEMHQILHPPDPTPDPSQILQNQIDNRRPQSK